MSALGVLAFCLVSLLGRVGDVNLFVQIFLVTLAVCLLKVVFSSNTVTATILIPLVIELGKGTGMDVTAITLAAGALPGDVNASVRAPMRGR